jgi:hypothetical protein
MMPNPVVTPLGPNVLGIKVRPRLMAGVAL